MASIASDNENALVSWRSSSGPSADETRSLRVAAPSSRFLASSGAFCTTNRRASAIRFSLSMALRGDASMESSPELWCSTNRAASSRTAVSPTPP